MQRTKSYATIGAAAAAGADDEPFRRFRSVTLFSGTGAAPDYTSPFDFDAFIPWVCKQWCTSTSVLIISKTQDQYVKYGSKRTSKSKVKKTKTLEELTPHSSIKLENKMSVLGGKTVPIIAYYDVKHRLVELAIIGSTTEVSRKIFHALSLSIPYHSMLTRFTFRRSLTTYLIIYEINRLLPISSITEVCFDDTYVKEGNYYILLENSSQVRYLSLNRCRINDDICKKIFSNLGIGTQASQGLQCLELGSNEITDVGAKYIASVLRVNRYLLHLNLSGNKITDIGFIPILDSLMEFKLTREENMELKRRKLYFLNNKMEVYSRCLAELKYGKSDDLDNAASSGRKLLMRRLRRKSRKIIAEQSVQDIAEMMAKGIVGVFHDPFSDDNVEYKNCGLYSKGNLVMCYINIAYNQIGYASVQRLAQVLSYQDSIIKSDDSGLVRITLDGNPIPNDCWELCEIDMYFKKILYLRTVSKKNRTSTIFSKKSYSKPGTPSVSTTS
ncbi:uncharacterized protein LOC110376836 [Helicoverpa armigera]|uniref:uncharacterized protein LOC110376836 n=1 Tax=Helicoverpa armigera TaxID=29058 RepID=UPI003083116B